MTSERAGPRRAGRRGDTARLPHADTEGPHGGQRTRVARAGGSRLGRDAQPERPLEARGAKKETQRSTNKKTRYSEAVDYTFA